jgi:hypothetical protein
LALQMRASEAASSYEKGKPSKKDRRTLLRFKHKDR